MLAPWLAQTVFLAALAAPGIASAPERPPSGVGDLPAPRGQTLTIGVTGFRNRDGALQCSLFSSRVGFPDHPDAAIATQRSPIGPDLAAECVFRGLVPGEYAVGVMHDENGNGKFDQGLFGVPLEGYGFSNNHTHAFSAPTWEESRFDVAPGEDPVLSVELRY